MPRLPRIPSLLVMRTLKKAGFYEFHQTGSHIQLRHLRLVHLRVTVPSHRTDLAPKTLKSIIAQAGLSIDEFIALL